MDTQPAANHSRGTFARFWPWLIVLVVLLFVGFVRVRLLNTPLERDEGEYAYAGQLILQGIPPYELAYNMKLPGTYYAYALGMAVFGQTTAGVHLTALVANALTIIFVFLLGRTLFGVMAGLAACASYGVMSLSPSVLGLAAHANHFVVLCAVPAVWWLWKAKASDGYRDWFLSGLLFGLSFVMKQQGVFFCLFGWLFLVWEGMHNKNLFSAGFAKRALVFGLGMVLPYSFVCLTCVIAGDFTRFWFWTVTYARWYATTLPLSQGMVYLERHLRETRDFSAGFWLLAVSGVALALGHKRSRGPAFFMAVFWLFSFLGTATGFYFRPHYFILVLPAFALLVGLGVAQWQRILRFRQLVNVFQSLPVIFLALALSWAIFYQALFFFHLSPRRVCEGLYGSEPFVEAITAAKYIREHSAPNARIAVFGSEPEIYFYARRHSATGYIYTYALMEPQPAALAMQHGMMQEIETNKPEYIVGVTYELSWLFRPYSHRDILKWFKQYVARDYVPVGFIHRNAAGDVESFWGAAAASHLKDGGQFLAIYKRKPEKSSGTMKAGP